MDATVTMDGMAKSKTLFGEKLRVAVRASALSQRELASAVGVHPTMLQQYFGGSLPNSAIAVKLARALDVDLEWLCDESNSSIEPKAPPPKIDALDDDVVFRDIRRRYALAAYKLDEALINLNKCGAELEHGVVAILGLNENIDDSFHPVAAHVTADADGFLFEAEEFQKLECRLLEGEDFLAIQENPQFYPSPEASPREALSRARLDGRIEAMLDDRPAVRALLRFERIKIVPLRDKRRLRDYWSVTVPMDLARVVSCSRLDGASEYDDLRKLLRSGGWITKQKGVVSVQRGDSRIVPEIPKALKQVRDCARSIPAVPVPIASDDYDGFGITLAVDRAIAQANQASGKPWWCAVAEALAGMDDRQD